LFGFGDEDGEKHHC